MPRISKLPKVSCNILTFLVIKYGVVQYYDLTAWKELPYHSFSWSSASHDRLCNKWNLMQLTIRNAIFCCKLTISHFGGTDAVSLAFIVSMCLVQGFLAATGFIRHLDLTLTVVPPPSLSVFSFS